MLAYIGCRTTKRRNARGKGIEVYRVTDAGRAWEHIQRFDGLVNPSYLILNRAGDRLYCIHGDCSGQVVADTFIKLLPRFSRSPSARGSQGSSGAGSCCTPSRYRSRRRASLTGGSSTAAPPAIRSLESRRSAP